MSIPSKSTVRARGAVPGSERSESSSRSTLRIAVLGAGGFIGSHLVPRLCNRLGATVDAVDVTFDKLAPGLRSVTRMQASIRDAGLLEEITERADIVVSLTALCNPSLYNKRPLDVIDANYTDLVPLVRLCAERRRWLVHLSTCEVYGRRALTADGRRTRRMDEDRSALCLGPIHRERWTYAAAKQLLERVIWAYGQPWVAVHHRPTVQCGRPAHGFHSRCGR